MKTSDFIGLIPEGSDSEALSSIKTIVRNHKSVDIRCHLSRSFTIVLLPAAGEFEVTIQAAGIKNPVVSTPKTFLADLVMLIYQADELVGVVDELPQREPNVMPSPASFDVASLAGTTKRATEYSEKILGLIEYDRHDRLVAARSYLIDAAESGVATFEEVEAITGYTANLDLGEFNSRCPMIEINGQPIYVKTLHCRSASTLAKIVLDGWSSHRFTLSAEDKASITPFHAQATIDGTTPLEIGDHFLDMVIADIFHHEAQRPTRAEVEDLIDDGIDVSSVMSEWTRIELISDQKTLYFPN